MSKKTRSNQVNAENRYSRSGLVVAAVAIVVIAVVAATLLNEGDDAPSLQDEAVARQAALASEHSPTLGDVSAKVHIVEFLDPACETCALFFPMVKQWMAEVPGEIRLSVRHVAFHSGSDYAVKVLEATRKQDKYWETLETLLASQHQWTQHHTVQPDAGILCQWPAAAQFWPAAIGGPGPRRVKKIGSESVRRTSRKFT